MSLIAKAKPARKLIGEVITELGLISADKLEEALKKATARKERLGRVLVKDGYVTEVQLAQALAIQFSLDYLSLENIVPTSEALQHLPANIARQYTVLPVCIENGSLVLALFDPLNVLDIATVRQVLKIPFKLKVSPETQLIQSIENAYSTNKSPVERLAERLTNENTRVDSKLAGKPKPQLEVAKANPEAVSVETLVNKIIEGAVNSEVSDIHIEAGDEKLFIRSRVHGTLQETNSMPIDLHPLLLARLKILANLDIAEKRQPQDGSFQHEWRARKVDIRLSTLPTVRGEKAVLRILDKTALKTDLEELGMDAPLVETLKQITGRPYGMLLVTGPTGSGKSTTVYSLLNLFNRTEKNIVTIEDPVEYKLEAINQVQVNLKAGLTFASALRSILRQDPDIIMVGEIRDRETAEIAIRAALTGHFVISTLHTNDSVSTIYRLMDMGIEPFLIASSLLGVVSQRLVRVLCPHCKQMSPVSALEHQLINGAIPVGTEVYHSKGCPQCNNIGYRGREAVVELLGINNELKQLITARASEGELNQILKNYAFKNLRERGLDKVLAGKTSVTELLRQTM